MPSQLEAITSFGFIFLEVDDAKNWQFFVKEFVVHLLVGAP